MMAALDSLRAEHALILEVIESRLPPDYVHAMLDFIRIYIDTNHHGKEERVLFSYMAADPFLAGISSILTDDHREGRILVDAIERALVEGRPVVHEVETYAAFIRVHIHRENAMMFDVAESELDAHTLSAMQSEFLAIESEVLGIGGAGRLLAPLQAAGV